ncbi:molybdopterin oxidoreductase [Desulfitobacterium hafniense DP7]|uniref:Molybdopterin oxidoreductase n=1 Tax=Desulfitobacterium hafniense DP7 TaxID=537010 RepID=G9XGQ9_DESHA|nr:molybdopterin-dependent oxidoreductase [Desulfitobacterium hafniense]EHL09094.1 molybdopterin oxidoreductase [Desulfitobacterium hafniense DP7]
MSRDKVLNNLLSRHQDEEYCYTTCMQNGCWDAVCVIKCRVKDNKIISVEPDDTINRGSGREDIGDELIKKGMIQTRACPMGHAWQAEIEAPTRILYPMKRVGGKGFGKGSFERISWDEALDTIAGKMREIIDKYGPYTILDSGIAFDATEFELAPWLNAGISAWGDHSISGHALGEKEHLGYDLVKALMTGESKNMIGFEAPDLFNSNLIVLWGFDPLVGWFGPVSYYLKLAKERGIPIIVIDPRYTISAEVLADQWIPIRPGTDTAMMLAVAQVLYEEELYDHDYVAQWVEPDGFAKWRDYVLGVTDGTAKTPEWAESITAIPAETIRGFARLYAQSKPVHLQFHYAGAKRHLGDYAAASAMLLQAMTGNLSIPGGCQTGSTLVTPVRLPMPMADWDRAEPTYTPPVVMNANKWAEAILLYDDYKAGRIAEQEYRRAIGSPPGSPIANVQMLILHCNCINNIHHVNKRMEAAAKVEFTWGWQWHINAPTAQFMDIVLPTPLQAFESLDYFLMGQERFMSAPSGLRNYFLYCKKALNPPGEVRPRNWAYTQLAKRLGIGEQYNPRMVDVPIETWDEELERIYREAYEIWAEDYDGTLAALGVTPKPWEEFLKKPVVRVEIEEPYYPYKSAKEENITPFETPSGKVEFYASTLANVGKEETRYGGLVEPMPVWEPHYMKEPANDSFYHPKTAQYPLALNTPVSVYRQHSCNDQNPRLRECYRHAVWMNPVDAKARGIKDGDKTRVFNELGEMIIPAYVTNKTIPGTVCIYHGSWYTPGAVKTETMPYGIDTRGACNLLIGDTHLPHAVGALLKAGLVQVENFGGEQ